MAIRKSLETPKVAPPQQKAPVAPLPPTLGELTKQVDDALANGIFSEAEGARLAAGIKASPQFAGEVAEHLKKQLGTDRAVSILEPVLAKLSTTLGVDPKELFFKQQGQSKVADHELGAGLAKHTKIAADEHDAGKHREASETRLANHKALLDGSKGVEGRPIGGIKGAAYDVGVHYAGVIEGKVDEHLGPEAQAFKGKVRDPIVATCGHCVHEISKNPDTMKALGDVAGSFGTDAFKSTLATAASNVGQDILTATKLTEVNVPAVQGAVSGITSAANRLLDLSKGTRFEAQVAEHVPKLVKGATSFGAKVMGGAKVASGAVEGAADVAKVAQGAKAGVQVAAGAGKAAGQSVPVLGQALGVVTTGLAAAEFLGNCAKKPRDWKRIGSAGLNTIGQAVGIFVPFVGAAVTVAKLGSDAAMNAHDKKHGKEEHKAWGAGDIAPMLGSATNIAVPFLESAGYDTAAIKGFHAKVEHLAKNGISSEELAKMPAAERDAMISTLMACQGEAEKMTTEAKGTPHEPAMRLLGEAFKGLVGIWRKSKNVEGSEDPAGERKKLVGEAMEATAKATTAKAIIDTAEAKGN